MACGCGCPRCRDAGFVDNGPFAMIAAQRYDGLGPGEREAGEVNPFVETPEQRNVRQLAMVAAGAYVLWFITRKGR